MGADNFERQRPHHRAAARPSLPTNEISSVHLYRKCTATPERVAYPPGERTRARRSDASAVQGVRCRASRPTLLLASGGARAWTLAPATSAQGSRLSPERQGPDHMAACVRVAPLSGPGRLPPRCLGHTQARQGPAPAPRPAAAERQRSAVAVRPGDRPERQAPPPRPACTAHAPGIGRPGIGQILGVGWLLRSLADLVPVGASQELHQHSGQLVQPLP